MQEGDASAVALLAMLQTATEGMPTAAAAEHATSVFELIMRALDCRQQQPGGMRDVGRVESQAVQAILAATMKLSEARFKPLFLRLLEWASVPSLSRPGKFHHCHQITPLCGMGVDGFAIHQCVVLACFLMKEARLLLDDLDCFRPCRLYSI